ncbi:MAG: hypothetical protein ACKVUT_17370 [Gaiella sp.]
MMRAPILAGTLLAAEVQVDDGRSLPVRDIILDRQAPRALGIEVQDRSRSMFVPWLALSITSDRVSALGSTLQPAEHYAFYLEAGRRVGQKATSSALRRVTIDPDGALSRFQ